MITSGLREYRSFIILGRVGMRLASMKQLEGVHVVELPEDRASFNNASYQLLRREVEQLVESLGVVQG